MATTTNTGAWRRETMDDLSGKYAGGFPPLPTSAMTGWLIENDRAQWLCVVAEGGALDWTSDSNRALCFTKEEDAFDFISLLPALGPALAEGAKPTPHVWLDGPNASDREYRLLARLAGESAMQLELDGMGSFPAEMYDYGAIYRRQMERLRKIVASEQITPNELTGIRLEAERLGNLGKRGGSAAYSVPEDRRPVPHPDEGVTYEMPNARQKEEK